MRQLLPLLLGDLALLALAGVGVLVWLPERWRSRMLPAVLTLGAIAWVVGLHLTGLLFGVRVGLWIVVGAAVAAIAVRSFRVPWWRGLGTWRYLVAGLAVGVIPVLLALGPARGLGASVVQPSPNNDAYEYVAVSQWLLSHPVLQAPPGLTAPPAWGKVNLHLVSGLRVGQELYGAAIAEALRRDPIQTWYVVTAGWLLLLPGTVVAAFDALRMRRLTGLAAGAVAAFSAVVVEQVLNSNSDAALGIAIAPLAVALIARYVDDRSELEAGSGVDPPPVWLPAAGAAAISAVYTEYLPLLIPALVLFVLVRPFRRLPRALLAGATVLALAVVIGALAWYRSALSFVTTTTTNSPIPSPFLDHAGAVAGRILGFVTYEQVIRASNWKVVLFVLVGLAGVGLAVTLAPARRLFACVLVACLGIIVVLSTPIHYFPYAQNRAVVVTVPLVLVMAVAGFGALLPRLANAPWIPRPAAAAVLVVLIGVGALFAGLNVRTTNANASYDISHRTVDGNFTTMSSWAHRVAGPDGTNLSVLVPNHFDQVWSMYYLRDLRQANYPFLYSDYTNIPPLHFDDGRLRRYVVVGADAFVDAAPGVVVGRTSRFLLLDTARGSATITFGIENADAIQQSGSRLTQWMLDDPSLMVAHTPDVQQATLTLVANPAVGSLPLTAAVAGGPTTPLEVGAAPRPYVVPLATPSRQTVQTVALDTRRPGKPLNPADPRPLTVAILGPRP